VAKNKTGRRGREFAEIKGPYTQKSVRARIEALDPRPKKWKNLVDPERSGR